jgi:hypothetical protein
LRQYQASMSLHLVMASWKGKLPIEYILDSHKYLWVQNYNYVWMLATCRNEGVSLAISHERGEEGGNQGFFFQIPQVGVLARILDTN